MLELTGFMGKDLPCLFRIFAHSFIVNNGFLLAYNNS